MATWADSDESSDEDEEYTDMALMTNTHSDPDLTMSLLIKKLRYYLTYLVMNL